MNTSAYNQFVYENPYILNMYRTCTYNQYVLLHLNDADSDDQGRAYYLRVQRVWAWIRLRQWAVRGPVVWLLPPSCPDLQYSRSFVYTRTHAHTHTHTCPPAQTSNIQGLLYTHTQIHTHTQTPSYSDFQYLRFLVNTHTHTHTFKHTRPGARTSNFQGLLYTHTHIHKHTCTCPLAQTCNIQGLLYAYTNTNIHTHALLPRPSISKVSCTHAYTYTRTHTHTHTHIPSFPDLQYSTSLV